LTRHELKESLQHDQFTDTVSNVVNYAVADRQKLIRWAVIAGIVLLIAGAAIWYSSYRSSVRQQDLEAAFAVLSAPVSTTETAAKSFPTPEAKTKASMKALADVIAKDGGTREGLIAQYYLGTLKAQNNDPKGAASDLNAVANSSSECAPLAKIALAQLYTSQNKAAEAQKLLREVVNNPTDLVSKTQAQVLLAQLLQSSNPQEAKKIVQSLKTPNQSPAVARALEQVSSQAAR
jgi:predicted negative regulator of RcsB-dependent stress response